MRYKVPHRPVSVEPPTNGFWREPEPKGEFFDLSQIMLLQLLQQVQGLLLRLMFVHMLERHAPQHPDP